MTVAAVHSSERRWLAGIGIACIAALAAALLAQHEFGMRPCPWCVLQRLIYLLVALLAVVAAVGARPLRVLLAGAVIALAVCGAAAAVYQHIVAAKQYSCNLTFADQVISALGLETLWPALFQVTATCADAAVDVFGVPFEYWSLALFALIAAVAARVLFDRSEAQRRSWRAAGGSRLGN